MAFIREPYFIDFKGPICLQDRNKVNMSLKKLAFNPQFILSVSKREDENARIFAY